MYLAAKSHVPIRFMMDGLDEDDGWVMVEDEFLSTAKLYTQHLHHAEYQRLKQLARARNASTMSSIKRPTDGKTAMSMQTRKKIEGFAQRQENAKAIRNVGGDDSDSEADSLDEEDPWMSDPRLAGLMTMKEPSAKLGRLTGTQSSTQASARTQPASTPRNKPSAPHGLNEDDLDIEPAKISMTSRTLQSVVGVKRGYEARSLFMEASNSDEDLDAGLRRKHSPMTTSIIAPKTRKIAPEKGPFEKRIPFQQSKVEQERMTTHSNQVVTSSNPSISEADRHGLPKKTALHPRLAEKLAKRKAEAAKLEAEKNKKRRPSGSLAEAPTFLL